MQTDASTSANPLLTYTGFPPYAHIGPAQVVEAVRQVIADNRQTLIDTVERCGDHPTWQNLMVPIEEADDRFSRVWTVVGHLNGVCNTPELRAAFEECIPLVSEYSAWAGQYRPLYDQLVALRGGPEFVTLSSPQQVAIDNALRDFRLSGIDLSAGDQRRYTEIITRLSQLETRFSNNLLDATKHFYLHVTDEDDLAGLPAGVRSLAAAEARKRQLEGWVFTLDFPSYYPFLMYSERRELRKQLYIAYQTRASDQGPDAGKWDNAPLIEEILALRHEEAQLLGFHNYAELSIYTKMAASTSEVIDFLNNLVEKSRPRGLEEMAQLREFAREKGAPELEPWDITYWSDQLKQARHAISAEELRPYFPVSRVMDGLFTTAARIYRISLVPVDGLEVWDPEVRCYAVRDSFGATIGTLYVDLFARDGKRGGAWMDECLTRRHCADGTLQLPVTNLVCNFTPPVDGRESELTHDEVVTLFHEFGHSLNHLLTRIDVPEVSGINGVKWDAVELPSQFNENFAWQEEVLSYLSSHVRTGAPLPKEKLDKLLGARNFEQAMAMLRQVEFALFDFRIHLEYDPASGARIYEILNDVKQKVAVVPQYPLARFPDGFSHIFAGGYAAGYYSYKWAEVLAADAFGRFEEEGVLNPAVGREFLEDILAVGGSVDPMAAFVRFRGRKPEVDALLRQCGII